MAAANKLNLPPFFTDTNNPVGYCVQGAYEFGINSRRLVQRCTKPDAKEFKKIAVACSIGFAIMGFMEPLCAASKMESHACRSHASL